MLHGWKLPAKTRSILFMMIYKKLRKLLSDKLLDLFLNWQIRCERKSLPRIQWESFYESIKNEIEGYPVFLETRGVDFIPISDANVEPDKLDVVGLAVPFERKGVPVLEAERDAKKLAEKLSTKPGLSAIVLLSDDSKYFIGYYVNVRPRPTNETERFPVSPFLERAAMSIVGGRIRSATDAARRCIVLYAVVAAGHSEPRAELVSWLRRENVWDAVSPEEAQLLTCRTLSREQKFAATWRIEALVPLLWAIERIPVFGSPTALCDESVVQAALPALYSPVSQFIAGSRIRNRESIWDAHESIYQIHWTIRDAQLNEKPIPNGYNEEIVNEWHHALNWLITTNQEWDDITTDT
jgi:hypothetical protein